ncbi:MAG: glutaredoxin, partial [Candidatus Levybacteria bacterium]|nr:glutaredoxin [Candidatus Levybacteria bacterium]
MQRILLFFLFLLIFLTASTPTKIFGEIAENEKTTVVVFVRAGCQHCKNEETFLKELTTKRNDIIVTFYRLENPTQRDVWDTFTTRTRTSKVTPITLIGNHYITGFDTPETTGKEILSLIEITKKTGTKTNLKSTTLQQGSNTKTCAEDSTIPCTITNTKSYSISIPFIGTIDTQKYPLFILSILLGFIDGFNPCAMWVLVTFLIILLQIGSRKKMFLFAGIFILAEALMYTMILTVWFKTWDFVQLDAVITPLVGIVAIGGGLFFLNEYRKKETVCHVTNLQQRHSIKKRIETLAFGKFTFFTFLGILGVAFSVNIIEFACSIGIPQAFTKILELNQASPIQSATAIALYILFYMIDDI